jgi:hypothetical protein
MFGASWVRARSVSNFAFAHGECAPRVHPEAGPPRIAMTTPRIDP